MTAGQLDRRHSNGASATTSIAIRRPPVRRKFHLLDTPLNLAITVVVGAVLLWALTLFGRWAFVDSVWVSANAEQCRETLGACWAVVHARSNLIFFGLYPHEEYWRSALCCAMAISMVVLSCVPRFQTPKIILAIWIVGALVFVMLLRGGVFGLRVVPPDQWGGLVLTLFVFICTMLITLPAGVALALARQSRLPAIRIVSSLFVDVVRAVPLIGVVFFVVFFGPFVLPPYLAGDKLSRAVVGFALFYSCLQAIVVSGGLQTVQDGQYEASQALGLRNWQAYYLVILPQALRISLPASVNNVVTAFKDTSLLTIVGLFELTASGSLAYQTGEWSDYYMEVFIFVGLIYFVFCYSLSRYGVYLEKSRRSID